MNLPHLQRILQIVFALSLTLAVSVVLTRAADAAALIADLTSLAK